MKISAVIVTYNPTQQILNTIEKLKNQVEKIYIIDNNSSQKEFLKLLKHDEKIEILYNETNIGLAAAQNLGIKKSIKEKYEWILFLDDDSKINDTLILELKKGYLEIENRDKIAIIAPNILYENINKKTSYPIKTNFFIKRVKFEEQVNIKKIMFVISSGSLIKVEVINRIGLFKEEFFIDHIDVEFCLRVNSYGYTILAIKDAILHQKVGNTSEKKIFLFKCFPTNHNPKRQFTKFRNAIWTWKKYILQEPKYIIYDILLMTNHFFRIILFENQKRKNIFNILKGIYTGIIKKECSKNV